MGEVVQFKKNNRIFRKLAEERAGKEDYTGALSFLFSAKSINPSYEVYMDIADAYADMGLLELSNKYWYSYMDKAPKDKVSVAFEELAINFFYMDNYWASSYYFNQKITTDGQIMKEGLDKEIIDFFSGAEFKKDAYRIAYPIEKADYTFEIKRAKHALALGAFDEAKKLLFCIPKERRNEEIAGDLAVACFMSDNLDDGEKVCRESILINGENITAYCNLSTIYGMREDDENAEYYYRKALEHKKGEKGEEYKLATCAIERKDHLMAKECLEKILMDRPYELSMRFLYGVCLINLSQYELAKEQFNYAYRINPYDKIMEFFIEFCPLLIDKDEKALKLLPLEYNKEIPKKVTKKYQAKIRDLVVNPQKIITSTKNKKVKNALEWAVLHGDDRASRDAVYVLSTLDNDYAIRFLKDALIDPEVKDDVKRVIIYALIVKGYKDKFSLVAGSFFVKIKPRKLLCEKAIPSGVYLSAYALCMARVAFWEGDGLDKIAESTDKIFKKLQNKITDSEVTNEELAGLILSECKYAWCKKDSDVTKFFDVSKSKLETLKNMLKGE